MNSPILPRRPLEHPGSIRILLGQAASDAIAANGDFHLGAITHPTAQDPEETRGRLILVAVPTTKQRLDEAARVILGTHRAVKISKPTTKPPTPPTK